MFTVDVELNRLADCWWDPVGCDAHVGSHLTPGDLVQLDLGARHLLG